MNTNPVHFDAAYAAGTEFGKDGFAFLQKPYTLEDFGRRLSELLAGSSVGDQAPT